MATIEIKNITINVTIGGASHGFAVPSGLLEALFGRAFAGEGDGAATDETGAAGTDAPAEAPATTEASSGEAQPAQATPVTVDQVIAFLGSDPRYTKRSYAAIAEALPGVSAAELDQLVASRTATTSTRRRDGAIMYSLAVPVQALNTSTLVAFLNSSTKYNKRSAEAIAKHFGVDDTAVKCAIDAACDLGVVESVYGRRSGQYRFKATVRSYDMPATETTASAAPVADTTTAASPELTVVNLRTFLTSNADHSLRSIDAIAKHFGVSTSSDELEELLENAESEGDVTTKRRRADGATLYAAA